MNFYKPFFKKLLNIHKTVILNYKIFNFKNKKWKNVILNFDQQLIKNKFYKFKLIDHNKLLLNFYSNKKNSYNLDSKFYFLNMKNLKIFYSNFLNKKLLKLNNYKPILELLERRIDIILTRSKLCLTLRESKKLIVNGSIYINRYKIRIKSYILNSGSFIKMKINLYQFKRCIINCFKWYIIFTNIIVNYASKELLFLNSINILNLVLYFPTYLYLKTMFHKFL